MAIDSLKLVCFSPTGTTKSIIRAVARGIGQRQTELIDLTRPDARNRRLQTSENELLVVAVPVYVGRVPALLLDWLQAVKARNTPAVCIVVYGNREYEDALLELKDIMTGRGCIPIACAAFIGEHAFSHSEAPIAATRPDAMDLDHAESFGRKIAFMLGCVSSGNQVPGIQVPGNRPYKEPEPLLSADFISVSKRCRQCGACAEACPVGAIDAGNSLQHDREKCILCCACIKGCLEGARTMKSGIVKDIAKRLSKTCNGRKEPVFFLD